MDVSIAAAMSLRATKVMHDGWWLNRGQSCVRKVADIPGDYEVKSRSLRAGNLHVVFKIVTRQAPSYEQNDVIHRKYCKRREDAIYGGKCGISIREAPGDVEDIREQQRRACSQPAHRSPARATMRAPRLTRAASQRASRGLRWYPPARAKVQD